MAKRYYLAGPFFNTLQVKHVERFEQFMDDNDIGYFSPRLECLCPPDASKAQQEKTFQANKLGIRKGRGVIALLDYLQDGENTIRVCKPTALLHEPCPEHNASCCGYGEDALQDVDVISGPLMLPDTGTVFEMGYAEAFSKPILGVRLSEGAGPPNLMLARSCTGFVTNLEDALEAIERGPAHWDNYQYEGRIV